MNDTRVSNDVKFDVPCEDNVSFTITKGILEADLEDPYNPADPFTPEDYLNAFETSEELPRYELLPSSIAMHEPIFPKVTETNSEQIIFSLTPVGRSKIESATLYIKKQDVEMTELLGLAGNYSYPGITEANFDSKINWIICEDSDSEGGYEMVISGMELRSIVPTIEFKTQIRNIPSDVESNHDDDFVTFVKYRFIVKYEDVEGLEEMEISFALQNYHKHLPEHPAPVYAQGDLNFVDILFIPARDYLGPSLNDSTLNLFRQSCTFIIKNTFFTEPILIYWRKEFNFWINKQEGEASDYRFCESDCSHTPPPNYPEGINADIEFMTLLHKTYQRDFTDEEDFISAQMDNSEYKFFLHELGHTAFNLADEYGDGAHWEEREVNFPNNWKRRKSAIEDAVLRHKTEDDVRRIK